MIGRAMDRLDRFFVSRFWLWYNAVAAAANIVSYGMTGSGWNLAFAVLCSATTVWIWGQRVAERHPPLPLQLIVICRRCTVRLPDTFTKPHNKKEF